MTAFRFRTAEEAFVAHRTADYPAIRHAKRLIINLIESKGAMTFHEIHLYLDPDGGWMRGERSLYFGGLPDLNMVLWVGLSDVAHDAIRELVMAGTCRIKRTNRAAYRVRGAELDLPGTRGIRQYPSPHWYPVKLAPGSK
jgi:hypothetical protein